jgi:hypothetical protein
MTGTAPAGTVLMENALQIARLDAEKAYRDLSDFRIVLVLRDDGWHVDFEMLSETAHGGGPHYLIDSSTGEIIWKRYDQ